MRMGEIFKNGESKKSRRGPRIETRLRVGFWEADRGKGDRGEEFQWPFY